ncbi:MAG: ankyrin repeat domain-containing protein [Treponema sp.]
MKKVCILLFLFLAMTQIFSARRDDERLPQAVRDMDLREVRDLISYGANVNATDEEGRTFVMIACNMMWLEGLKALIDGSADVNKKDRSGATPLIVATQLGWKDGIEVLINAYANVNEKDASGKTALMHAVLNADFTTLSTLLKARNIDYNIKDPKGNTAFMLAATQSNHNIVKAFFDASEVNWSITNDYGNNALSIAILSYNTIIVRSLLAKIWAKNTYINHLPCIFWAIKNECYTQIIEMLMDDYKYRELVNLRDTNGHDIYWYIKTYNSSFAKQKLKDMKRAS